MWAPGSRVFLNRGRPLCQRAPRLWQSSVNHCFGLNRRPLCQRAPRLRCRPPMPAGVDPVLGPGRAAGPACGVRHAVRRPPPGIPQGLGCRCGASDTRCLVGAPLCSAGFEEQKWSKRQAMHDCRLLSRSLEELCGRLALQLVRAQTLLRLWHSCCSVCARLQGIKTQTAIPCRQLMDAYQRHASVHGHTPTRCTDT